MSFNGYYECICSNGHRFNSHVDYDYDEKHSCPHCDNAAAFLNLVDETNGGEEGIICDDGWEYLLISPAEDKICNLGHKHRIKQAVYRIPSVEEMQVYRVYSSGNCYV